MPFPFAMPDGRVAGDRRDASGGIVVFALDAPASRPEEEGVVYP
jgi:hypothetical protein